MKVKLLDCLNTEMEKGDVVAVAGYRNFLIGVLAGPSSPTNSQTLSVITHSGALDALYNNIERGEGISETQGRVIRGLQDRSGVLKVDVNKLTPVLLSNYRKALRVLLELEKPKRNAKTKAASTTA